MEKSDQNKTKPSDDKSEEKTVAGDNPVTPTTTTGVQPVVSSGIAPETSTAGVSQLSLLSEEDKRKSLDLIEKLGSSLTFAKYVGKASVKVPPMMRLAQEKNCLNFSSNGVKKIKGYMKSTPDYKLNFADLNGEPVSIYFRAEGESIDRIMGFPLTKSGLDLLGVQPTDLATSKVGFMATLAKRVWFRVIPNLGKDTLKNFFSYNGLSDDGKTVKQVAQPDKQKVSDVKSQAVQEPPRDSRSVVSESSAAASTSNSSRGRHGGGKSRNTKEPYVSYKELNAWIAAVQNNIGWSDKRHTMTEAQRKQAETVHRASALDLIRRSKKEGQEFTLYEFIAKGDKVVEGKRVEKSVPSPSPGILSGFPILEMAPIKATTIPTHQAKAEAIRNGMFTGMPDDLLALATDKDTSTELVNTWRENVEVGMLSMACLDVRDAQAPLLIKDVADSIATTSGIRRVEHLVRVLNTYAQQLDSYVRTYRPPATQIKSREQILEERRKMQQAERDAVSAEDIQRYKYADGIVNIALGDSDLVTFDFDPVLNETVVWFTSRPRFTANGRDRFAALQNLADNYARGILTADLNRVPELLEEFKSELIAEKLNSGGTSMSDGSVNTA